MRWVKADLHIHTALSPCALKDMTPRAIVAAAAAQRLGLIAICDHNSAGNVAAVHAAAGNDGIAVLAGMEISTAEDVHVLGIFPDVAAAGAAAGEVGATLPESASGRFGEALLMNANGGIVGREPRMLSASCGLTLACAVELIRRCGGVAIASHIDRPSYSVLSQLGVWPRDVRFDAAEISAAGMAAGKDLRFGDLGLPLVTSSDGHSPGEIGAAFTMLNMNRLSYGEFAEALLTRPVRRMCGDV